MFGKVVYAAMFAAPLLLGLSSGALAGPFGGLTRAIQPRVAAPYIATQRPTLAPFAYVKFCVQNPADCRASGGPAMVDLTDSKRRQLLRINGDVNRSIRPVNDANGVDDWEANTTSGDCEDFALTKRRKLIQLGWSARSLRMAVARTRSGEGHAVLVVKTSEGDLVLDNRFNSVRPFNRTALNWVKIQSADNPRLWFDI